MLEGVGVRQKIFSAINPYKPRRGAAERSPILLSLDRKMIGGMQDEGVVPRSFQTFGC